jgi:NDP-sugar pyrophosphorylase family protein
MKAIILAGGKGTRLRPFTAVIPKPLVPVGDRTILEILICRLKKEGITDLVLCVNHMSALIKAYFGDGAKWGVRIGYSEEEGLLGTVAPIKLVKNLPDDFLVMNGDLLTDLRFRDLYHCHLQNRSLLTIATCKRTSQIEFGVIDVDNTQNVVTGFREKPVQEVDVSMGVYAFNRRVLQYVPGEKPFGFDDLVLKLLCEKCVINVYPFSGYWLDIGRPADYDKANQDIAMPVKARRRTRRKPLEPLVPAREDGRRRGDMAGQGAPGRHGRIPRLSS